MKKSIILVSSISVLVCGVLGYFLNRPVKMDENWYKHMAIYQIFVKSYKDTNGDGLGDLRGVTEKLDYIKSLGVNAIYFNPISEALVDDTRLRSHLGYEIKDFKKIMPEYGTIKDLKKLVKEAHKRDIRVILDFITTVISVEHPFFKHIQTYKNSPYRKWFYVKDSIPDGVWMNFNDYSFEFQSSPWKPLKTGGYYYSLWGDSPMLDYHYKPVMDYIYSVVDYWMDVGVDGFRMDAAKHMFINGPGQENQYHQPENFKFYKKLRQHLNNKYGKDKVLLAEVLPIPSNIEYILPNREMFDAMVDHSMIEHMYKEDVFDLKQSLKPKIFHNYYDNPIEFMKIPLKDRVAYLTDHDITRMSDRSYTGKDEDLKLIAANTLLSPAHVKIFAGEELGAKGVEGNPDDISEWKNSSLSVFCWEEGELSGFTKAKSTIMPTCKNAKTHNMVKQDKDPNSILNTYRDLLRVKNAYPELFYSGTRISLNLSNTKIYAFYLTGEKRTALVVSNFDTKYNQKAEVVLPYENKNLKVDKVLGNIEFEVADNKISFKKLKPFETAVFIIDGLTKDTLVPDDVEGLAEVDVKINQEYVSNSKELYVRNLYSVNNQLLKIKAGQGKVLISMFTGKVLEKRTKITSFDIDTSEDVYVPLQDNFEAFYLSKDVEFSLINLNEKEYYSNKWKSFSKKNENPTFKELQAFNDKNFWHFKFVKNGYALPANAGLDYCMFINPLYGDEAQGFSSNIYGLPNVYTKEGFSHVALLERHKGNAAYYVDVNSYSTGIMLTYNILSFETQDAYYLLIPRQYLPSDMIRVAPFVWSAMGRWGDKPPAVGPVVERLTTGQTEDDKFVGEFVELR
ncbi:MAG: alpha-amylase family glycosyl hydrolase [Alphaproteobacteria bacterium]|nr:alpha-amylase family glycosyl hydrolase [Alphaproteobacteria bacterium]